MKRPVIPGQIPLNLAGDQSAPPEWSLVQAALHASLSLKQHDWLAFSGCRHVEVYTDGSAPIKNPGGPAGFSAVVVGFDQLIDSTSPSRPHPVARVDLAGFVPARTTDPKTSNNRAELAAVLAALAALQNLNLENYTAREIVIWSDSDLTVKCGNGEWGRKRNIDLWRVFDDLSQEVKGLIPSPFALKWLKGHAGNTFNEAADHLATLAALNFDQGGYARLRNAQAATGREIPGNAAMEREAEPKEASNQTPTGVSDYSIVLVTDLDNGPSSSGGPATGHYLLQTRTGQSFRGTVAHPQVVSSDEAEYRTLLAALKELLGRIEGRGKEPGTFTLGIMSFREVVINQLDGSYRVRASTLVPLYTETKAILSWFKEVELVWKSGADLRKLMRER